MKMTEKQLTENYNAIQKILNLSMNGSLAVDLFRNARAMKAEYEIYSDASAKLIEKYGLKDENGKYVMIDETHIQIKPDCIENFTKDYQELNDKEVEIEIKQISSEEFAKCEAITPNELLSIDFMIKE